MPARSEAADTCTTVNTEFNIEVYMYITCLDLEGVLVPEIWIAFSEASGIPELKRTTRDEPDYDKLMKWRLGILKGNSGYYCKD